MIERHPDEQNFDKDDDGWYFWDETGCDRYGPYETRELMLETFERYCKEVLGV